MSPFLLAVTKFAWFFGRLPALRSLVLHVHGGRSVGDVADNMHLISQAQTASGFAVFYRRSQCSAVHTHCARVCVWQLCNDLVRVVLSSSPKTSFAYFSPAVGQMKHLCFYTTVISSSAVPVAFTAKWAHVCLTVVCMLYS